MISHSDIATPDLIINIRKGKINLAGNRKLKIYGTLYCRSGKRMKKENRVFFSSAEEAITYGYRPCGHCMKNDYKKWIYSPLN
jgi:hypothetical protein